jgi:hypothetical protein
MNKSTANLTAAVLTVAMVFVSLMFPGHVSWVVVALCMTAFLVVLGVLISKRPLGMLVNDRNLMSLSRFQMIVWTVILLSAYFVIVMARIAGKVPDALAVKMDWQLWALMGISSTSLVGSPLINSMKKEKTVAASETTKAAEALVKAQNTPDSLDAQKADVTAVETKITATRQGTLYSNPTIADASFADMFEVQMFFFTIIAAIAYIAALFPLLTTLKSDPASVIAFPPLHESLIALLGISHTSFLVSKGVSHTKE